MSKKKSPWWQPPLVAAFALGVLLFVKKAFLGIDCTGPTKECIFFMEKLVLYIVLAHIVIKEAEGVKAFFSDKKKTKTSGPSPWFIVAALGSLAGSMLIYNATIVGLGLK